MMFDIPVNTTQSCTGSCSWDPVDCMRARGRMIAIA